MALTRNLLLYLFSSHLDVERNDLSDCFTGNFGTGGPKKFSEVDNIVFIIAVPEPSAIIKTIL
jgi:hypothetical protein